MTFDRGTSFGGGEFSFAPDLFSWALGLGGFGLRGLGFLGLSLLHSGLGGFGWDAGLESPYWGPGSTLYPTEILTCPR